MLNSDANVAKSGDGDEDFADFEEAEGEPHPGAAGEEKRSELDTAAGL